MTRLNCASRPEQRARVLTAATRRTGIFYDAGFDLRSRRESCSRFAREAPVEATGHRVGGVETFAGLLVRRPDAKQTFWRASYFGRIFWQRETVTLAILLRSREMRMVCERAATRRDTTSAKYTDPRLPRVEEP